ncbi:MAG: three-Cys-motif partner protein TcmP [Bacteroidota bacterium]
MGGKWTEQKLDAFIAYVKAYLTIMKKNPYWKTIYFDGFAGMGRRIIEKEKNNFFIFLEDDFQSLIEDIRLYEGSVKRVLSLPELYRFNYYYFIDSKSENVAKLKELAKEYQNKIIPGKIEIRQEDCNKELLKLAAALKNKNEKLASLIFIDPFGMQVNWESIASLKKTRSDIWILIPSGVIINRLLLKTGQIKYKEKLEKFFGLPINEIRQFFYSEKKTDGLFGVINTTKKKNNPIEKIVQLYVLQLKTVWKNVTEKPLILKNSKNVSIYHLLFASNNANAKKIASQIIGKKQK